jgi:protease I
MKIACLLGQDFEDSEFQKPALAFKEAGHEVCVIGMKAGEELKGKKGTVSQKSDESIDEVEPGSFDALFIPGGGSPDHLRVNEKMVAFTKSMFDEGKPVFAICHGPQLLLAADCYKDVQLTAWQTIQDDLKKAGANVVDEEVVVDKNLVTSRKPDDIPAFIDKSLGLLQSRSQAA